MHLLFRRVAAATDVAPLVLLVPTPAERARAEAQRADAAEAQLKELEAKLARGNGQ